MAQREATKVRMIEGVAAPRPDNVPEGWEIYNAPRPLYGHMNWQGEFRRGIFYVAIDPEGYYADELRRRTIQNNGHLCVWVSRQEIMTFAEAYCKKYDVDMADFGYRDFVRAYVRHGPRE